MARVIPPLSLLTLTDAEYGDFAERQVAETARQRVEARERTLADAQHRASKEQADLLTNRLRGDYGQALLRALHEHLVAEGVEALYLRVYDWDVAAWRLYAHCGYEVVRQFATDAHLRKHLTAIR